MSTAQVVADVVSYVGCIGLVIACVIVDLKRNPRNHLRKFVNFRTLNWAIVGFSYAFAYMARYNISCANTKDIQAFYGVTSGEYGTIILTGNIAYAISVVINGFTVDMIGAKLSMVCACIGSGFASIMSGAIMQIGNLRGNAFIANACVWYVVNNFFQTFATCAIVKLGANWYDITERGFFSGIFGVVISFGFFLAFQIDGLMIKNPANLYLAFIVPGCCLFGFAALNYFFVHALPEDKFEPEEITSLRAPAVQLPKSPKKVKCQQGFIKMVLELIKPILFQKIFYVLALIEVLLGYCRDGYLNYYKTYFSTLGLKESVQCTIAATGITIGGMFGSLLTGIISDSCFKSRRQPVAFIDFGFLLLGSLLLIPCILYDGSAYGAACMIAFNAIFFNGINGILTSTMSMDFAGSHSSGTASGLLDGIQKIGSSLVGVIVPGIVGQNPAPKDFVWWAVSFTVPCVLSMALFAPIMKVKAKSANQAKDVEIDDGKDLLLENDKDTTEGEDKEQGYHQIAK